jgi:excisionase family DNA binding protein
LNSTNSQSNRSQISTDFFQEPLGTEISHTTFEPFVDADEAARFLSLSRKYILKMALHGVIPAHPLGLGQRKTWRFLLSELRDWMLANANSHGAKAGGSRTIGGGGSRKGGQ